MKEACILLDYLGEWETSTDEAPRHPHNAAFACLLPWR